MTFQRRRAPLATAAGAVAVLALVLGSMPAEAVGPSGWHKPGVPFDGQQHPDPSVTTLGPVMYSYATKHGGSDLPMSWSADGVTWTARTQWSGDRGYLDGDSGGFFNDTITPKQPWGTNSCRETNANRQRCDPKSLWAPGVSFIGNQWVAYHAVKISRGYTSYGRYAIYGTRSASPLGLFTPVRSKAMVTSPARLDPAGVLDPELFTNPSTGKSYLLWKTEGNTRGRYPKLWSRRLNASGTSFLKGSKPHALLTVTPRSWEGRVIENPSMIKVDGKYLLFYSGNEYSSSRYATAYAICSSPTGGCRKKGRVLTSRKGSYAPGGADAVIDDRGRSLLVHHAYPRVKGSRGQGGRMQRVAEFRVRSGKVVITQRSAKPSPGTSDGISYGGTGAAFSSVKRRVTGIYTPFVANIDGDSTDDVGLYGTWNRPDEALLSQRGRGAPALGGGTAVGQKGTLVPISGDFDGDGRTDVYWYQPGPNPRFQAELPYPANDQLWLAKPGGGWRKLGQGEGRYRVDTEFAQDSAAIPVVGDFDGKPGDELWWVQPGSGKDEKWSWNPGTSTFSRSSTSIAASGTSAPRVGDLDGNGRDDIVWYTPGSATASIWWDGSSSAKQNLTVSAETRTYGRRPVVGDFDGNGHAEILWYGPRGRPSTLWSGLHRSSTPRSATATGLAPDRSHVYGALVGDFDDDGKDDIYWYG